MNTTTVSRSNMLGRCTCKTTVRVEVAIERQQWVTDAGRPGGSTKILTAGVTRWNERLVVSCPACTTSITLKGIHGYQSDKACSASCRNGRRPDCECSCVGANHGTAHTITL
jgi:hypothetical protein